MTRPHTPPRRILYIENGIGYGGAIICLRHLVRNLDRDQYDPMVITGRTGPQYEEIATEAHWQHIPDRHVDVVGMRERLAQKQWPDKIPGVRWLLNQGLARLDDIGNFLPFFLGVLKTARRFKPNIIHVNNEPLCNRAGILVGKLLKIPVICHVRGDQEGSAMMGWMFRLPDHFTPVSHWVSASIGRLGVPEEKRTVVYDGLELEKLDTNADGRVFREQYGLEDDDFVVGLVGLIIPWKGQRIFLEAARQLRDKIPNLKMLIVGGTPDDCRGFEQELRQTVKEWGLEETVIFTGHVTDMPVVYNGLDVVVSASTSPEPLGTMVIETLTMARPLVAPNHGGGAEMTEHGVSAMLFEPGNAASLAEMIHTLFNDKGLRDSISTAARASALARFSVEQHVQSMQKIYQKILS